MERKDLAKLSSVMVVVGYWVGFWFELVRVVCYVGDRSYQDRLSV